MKPIIRTSDRGQFKRCRELWNFGSKIRMNYEYVPGNIYLDTGTAWHAGMEVLFDPKRVGEPSTELVVAEAKSAMIRHMLDWKQRMVKTNQFDQHKDEYEEMRDLLPKMLDHFLVWQLANPLPFKPVLSEIEFEVPIPVPDDWPSEPTGPGFGYGLVEGYEGWFLYYDGEPVWYQGRIDLIGQMDDGKLVVVDWKTAGQFWENMSFLNLDPQMKAYAWAARRMLGLDVEGVVYFEFRKKVPEPPAILKNGGLSRNKSQSTTVEMYEKAIVELGLNRADYEDFLPVLAANQQAYFRHTDVFYTDAEMEMAERAILDEAIDMLNNPRIYPNPSRWNCNGCQFQTPCLQKQDQSDYMYTLDKSGLYAKR